MIYDAHSGFDADAFGAVSGLIRAGGLLLLLTPPLDKWPEQYDPEAERFFKSDTSQSRFIKRFITIAQQSDGIVQVSEATELPELAEATIQETKIYDEEDPSRTEDQAQAVDAIINAATARHHHPVVLVSDRGRGKSSALGIAAAQLLQQQLKRILVTGPRLNSVAPVFEHAHRLLNTATQSRGLIALGDARLEYIAPDELIATTPEADLLLVDEAAAIPTPMLAELLANYKRIAFATTVHGYEGTGRGFALRFNKVLDQQTPGWQQLRMQQPIRWSENDPLEQFVFDALLLNATIAAEVDVAGLDQSTCQVEMINRDQLMQDETLLSQVFGMLVLAHYRTRPNDLRQLLDSSGLLLYIIRHQQHIVGVALMIEEGGIDKDLGKQVYLGQRRLHGHLLPQSLATHTGMIEASTLHYLRIMRIAIHPAVQGRGLGTKLIRHITQQSDLRYDCIGTSFGVTTELFRFWQALGFVPVRIGITREHSSGTYSLIMLHPVSEAGQQLTKQAYARLQIHIPYLLSDSLRNFDQQLAHLLIDKAQTDTPELTRIDWQDIISFAYGARGYEFCIAAITKLAGIALTNEPAISELDSQQRQLLRVRVMQRGSWAETVSQANLSGRSAAIKLLRETIQLLVEHFCPDEIRLNIRQLLDL